MPRAETGFSKEVNGRLATPQTTRQKTEPTVKVGVEGVLQVIAGAEVDQLEAVRLQIHQDVFILNFQHSFSCRNGAEFP